MRCSGILAQAIDGSRAANRAPEMHPINCTSTMTRPKVVVTPRAEAWKVVGKPEPKVDAIKLVQGKPAFTADIEKQGMLVAKMLHSPHAHARIRSIDVTAARALPGRGGGA